ncbi:MAG: bifunctional methylenetetrahydrofolate dehydrogenase/methenyltetrahydrofolate cyclohydrolase FolD [Arenicellales bacterium]|jgi:methylenetetrahydrofolate dehydrogenase (NADP+)/methenyltetrahydrofolate cyclohydrolase|nr:bifunctional methylenetetrahydrofolate dehydrogenase/methenyltetrahydrofolate cyclohydrolase FolD [Arenicellales bacterium]MDP6854327.1 bifunctional methylenetetrahydrofolate dehydrogenase/methenyltetrahydrofolate cyclohydrolase FolD [Arenicellales bacterium]MDP6948126.1 bifunctional methylenetetrahydrofolate dehydrogenase/methenyltetrahydrofolate cyclohydrolase FolD [Arenicellales bacterium]
MATLIDGKAFAATVCKKVGQAVSALKAEHDLLPGLAVVLVGDDPASQVYVRNKGKQTLETGMQSFEHRLADTTTEEELLHLIEQLNHDARVHGILVQLPLPAQIDSHAVINSINPDKDVDGFHLVNVGRLATGAPGLVPCTPLGCMMLLKNQIDDLTGANAVIVGRSNIVGKPMGALLMAQHCTVTTAHSRTRELPSVCREADILVAAVGRAQMISGDWIKPGAVVIDVGINRIKGEDGKTRLVGDVDFASAAEVAGAITPVPGGVGPMTIACLLRNTVQAACAANGIAFSLD